MTTGVIRPDPFANLPSTMSPGSSPSASSVLTDSGADHLTEKTTAEQARQFVAQRLSEGWLLSDLHSFAWGDREEARRAAKHMPGRYEFLGGVIRELNTLRTTMDIE